MKPVVLPVGQNGKLVYIATDRFKSELLSLSLFLPLRESSAQQNAMIAALSRRGTRNYPTQALLSRHLDEMYSTAISTANRRMGDMQMISFTADFLGAGYVGGGKGLLPEVISLLGEMLLSPLFDEGGEYLATYVESEKQVLRDAIRAAVNDPRGFAHTNVRKLLCGGEPYGLSLIGEADTVDTLTPKNLTARYHALFRELAPVWCYVGGAPATEVVSLLEAQFPTLGSTPTPYFAQVHAHKGGVRTGEMEMLIEQGRLSLGFRADIAMKDPLAPALVLMNEIFGGSPASKLFMNVREKLGLCYHCSSSLDLFKGVLFAACGIKSSNRAVAEEAMLAELKEIRRGNFSETEFDAARRSLANTYRAATDNPAVLSRFYTGRLAADAFEEMDAWRARLSRVTREEIVAAAERTHLGAVFFLRGSEEVAGE